MPKRMTVADLYEAAKGMMKLGYGDKHILISSDDEGNEFHGLYYLFTTDKTIIEEMAKCGMFHDKDNPEDVVILG